MSPWYRLGIFKLARALSSVLPRALVQPIAGAIGRGSFRFNSRARQSLRENLSTVTGLSGDELDALCRRNFSNFVKMLGDYFYSVTSSPAAVRSMVNEWRGLENVLRARERGHGALLVTGHIGNWEMGATLLATEGLPMTIVTLDEPSSGLTQWRSRQRERLGIRTIAVGSNKFSFVEMIQTLRNNGLLAMLVDRPYGETGVAVEMFGRSTLFSSAAALLWQHTRATVLPAFVLHDGSGGYVSRVDAPVNFADGEENFSKNTQELATHFEHVIREHPEQWFQYVPKWQK